MNSKGYVIRCGECNEVCVHTCKPKGVFVAPLTTVKYINSTTGTEYRVLGPANEGFLEVCWSSKHSSGVTGVRVEKLQTLNGQPVLGVKGRSHVVQ